MKDEELKQSSEEQGTEETTAGKAEEVKTEPADEKEAEASEAGETSEEADAADDDTEKLKKKYEAEIADWKDKYTRLYAEFDNFRKRTEKEKIQNFDFGARDVIEKLLPVVDNFERALGTVEKEDEEDAFTKGVQGIYKQIQKMFEDLQVKAIKAEGEKFDPSLHNAVMTDTESDVEEDTITQDLQKGYTYKDQVVRHSMVKVKK
ncbi:nucleotide exchange factor GrpE [Oribacterium sp. WCC10]|uniref:nucleotide exchange factor GrpE n=1 Tax=Oribacterium sp. WCC10 TaxID=1855343 RepID=UPI0008E4C68F|nr:nucleotide exchange factor GrpE [Oribacterium sp. WCC10]SFG39047.1 molecular chaperone GrpE [Oribacterium sp. WCC10]